METKSEPSFGRLAFIIASTFFLNPIFHFKLYKSKTSLLFTHHGISYDLQQVMSDEHGVDPTGKQRLNKTKPDKLASRLSRKPFQISGDTSRYSQKSKSLTIFFLPSLHSFSKEHIMANLTFNWSALTCTSTKRLEAGTFLGPF